MVTNWFYWQLGQTKCNIYYNCSLFRAGTHNTREHPTLYYIYVGHPSFGTRATWKVYRMWMMVYIGTYCRHACVIEIPWSHALARTSIFGNLFGYSGTKVCLGYTLGYTRPTLLPCVVLQAIRIVGFSIRIFSSHNTYGPQDYTLHLHCQWLGYRVNSLTSPSFKPTPCPVMISRGWD